MFESIAALVCALGIALVGYTLALIVANWWADMWYTAEGAATHCEACGSECLGERITATAGDGVPSETETQCNDCGHFCGAWAYGWHDPFYRDASVGSVMCWARYAGPLLAVGVALWLI